MSSPSIRPHATITLSRICRQASRRCACGSLPGPGGNPTDGVTLNTRPQEYIERYCEKNYVVRDPVVSELRRSLNPFSWGDVRSRGDLTKSERTIIDEARDFGANDGLVVPIVTLSGLNRHAPTD